MRNFGGKRGGLLLGAVGLLGALGGVLWYSCRLNALKPEAVPLEREGGDAGASPKKLQPFLKALPLQEAPIEVIEVWKDDPPIVHLLNDALGSCFYAPGSDCPGASDPLLDGYLASLSRELLKPIGLPKPRIGRSVPKLRAWWTCQRGVQAMAFGTSNFSCYTGTLFKASSERDLALILGHELGHLTFAHCREPLDRLIYKKQPNFLTKFQRLQKLREAREKEFEADCRGLALVTAMGWDPKEALSGLNLLGTMSELCFFSIEAAKTARIALSDEVDGTDDYGQFELEVDHPHVENRLARLQGVAENLVPLSNQKRALSSLEFHLAKARAYLLWDVGALAHNDRSGHGDLEGSRGIRDCSDAEREALYHHFHGWTETGDIKEKVAGWYGLALGAHLEEKGSDEAQNYLARIPQAFQDHPWILELRLHLLDRDKDPATYRRLLEALQLSLTKHYSPAMAHYALADLAYAQGRLQENADHLEKAWAFGLRNSFLCQRLQQAYGYLGDDWQQEFWNGIASFDRKLLLQFARFAGSLLGPEPGNFEEGRRWFKKEVLRAKRDFSRQLEELSETAVSQAQKEKCLSEQKRLSVIESALESFAL